MYEFAQQTPLTLLRKYHIKVALIAPYMASAYMLISRLNKSALP
jgi:hypothetical protein